MNKKIILLIFILVISLSCTTLSGGIGDRTKVPKSITESLQVTQEGNPFGTKASTPTNKVKVSNVDSRFIGIWSFESGQEASGIIQVWLGDIFALQDNSKLWSITRMDTYKGAIQIFRYNKNLGWSWRSDEKFLYINIPAMPPYHDSITIKYKYSFINSDSIELVDEKGNVNGFDRKSNNPHHPLQEEMQGTWECTYDAGYGETASAQVICDDSDYCKGPDNLPYKNLQSDFLYIPPFLYIVDLSKDKSIKGTNYELFERAYISDWFLLCYYDIYKDVDVSAYKNIGGMNNDTYYGLCTGILRYSFTGGLFNEFGKIIECENHPYFYNSCKKIGE